MTTVQNHIKELLFEQDCVVIPDFGGFITNFEGAKINEGNRFITPPQKWLAFNALLKNDDGLLCNYIANQENISHEEANLKVKNFVNTTKKAIQFEESHSIEGLGIFSQNEEKSIQFQTRITHNFFNESFGMNNIYLKKATISSNELQISHTPTTISNQTIQQVFASENREPMAEVLENDEYVKYPKRRFSKVLPVVYGLFGAAFLMSAIYLYDNKKPNLSSLNPFQSQAYVQPIAPPAVKEIVAPTATTLNEKITSAPFEEIKPEKNIEVEKTISKSNNRFFIITGSFGSKQNAKKMLNNLKSKGFEDAVILYPKNNEKLIKVSAGGFMNESDADQKAIQVAESINQATWIYKK